MKIRDFAKANGHEVVGKLTRHPEYEIDEHYVGDAARVYLDEANNEYQISKQGVCIITAEGGVI